jgi:hypothetical protein
MAENFIRAKEFADLWGITPRRINQLCQEGLLPGAYKEGKFWMIPSNAEKPAILRDKQTKSLASRPKTTRLLPCPVGITSYKEVSKECYYVDKTLLIKDIIDDHSKVYLFTRPRRFGKTLTMDMVRTFFEKTSEDTSEYFTDKKIWFAGSTYREYQGSYPTIFLSFKDAHHTVWSDMYKSLCFTIKDEFLRHIELLSSNALNEYEKKYFSNIIDDNAEFTDYQFALGKLSSMLAVHYKQKVIIIIDEYDTPIQQGLINGYYDNVVGFMRNLLSAALKDNENLEFGIMTGILRIAKESLFSGLNNLVVNTILDDKYSDYFGFTAREVSDMAAYYGKEDKQFEIKEWYNGYLFGNTEIYNPWSVISYFNNNCKPKAFWSRTSGNEIIGQLIKNTNTETYQSLSLLLQGWEVQSIIDTDIIYPEVNGDSDTIYSFLLVTGYLRVTAVISELNDNPICSLEIPNREIKSVFQKEILDNSDTLFKGSLLRNFETALRTGNTDLFTDTLQKYLVQSASTFDTAQENFYHGTVFGMLAIMSDNYFISSNKESGDGRFDIQLEPKDKTQTGYIIEFKAGKKLSSESLSSLAMDAINQIRDMKYYTEMEYHGIKNIGLFGIAFSGKHVAAEYIPLILS